jgi:polar amino acid transport system substrate-binding protein
VTESRPRIWQGLARGDVQLTLSAHPTAERRQLAEFWPYLQTRVWLLMPAAKAQGLSRPADFNARPGLRLLAVRSAAQGEEVDAWIARLRSQGRVAEAVDFQSLLRLLSAGRGDAILLPASALDEARRQLGPAEDWALLDFFPQARIYSSMAVARSVPAAQQQRLSEALRGMKADGSLMALLVRHLGEATAREQFYAPAEPPARASSIASP